MSYKTAADFVKSSGGYSRDQIGRLYLYPDGKNHYQNHSLEGGGITSTFPRAGLVETRKMDQHWFVFRSTQECS